MQQSDLDGIERSGATARERGESFFGNPHLQQSDEAFAAAWAWWAGWRAADGGRDAAQAALDRVEYW